MLVLSRKVGERIVIDNETTLTVLSIKGGRVRLGIEAPPYVRVDRAEVSTTRLEAEEVERRLCVAREPA